MARATRSTPAKKKPAPRKTTTRKRPPATAAPAPAAGGIRSEVPSTEPEPFTGGEAA